MIRNLILVTALVMTISGCSGPVTPPEFDGERSFTYLDQQVAFGPRVPGTPAAAACRAFLYDHLNRCGLEVDSQVFSFFDPYGRGELPLINIIGRHRGGDADSPGLLLMAHYDSRPRTDYHSDSTLIDTPIDGANDGASGVAVLLELANLIAERSPDCNVDLVLVDGEDWGKPGDHDYYLLGSREFAHQGIRDDYRFGVVVDLIGDRYLQVYREEYTEQFYKPINDMIWQVAAELGVEAFKDGVRHTIIDDHLSLGSAGVPTALLIDFTYPHWHTENDTPDKCAPESLASIGRVLAHIVYNESLWPSH